MPTWGQAIAVGTQGVFLLRYTGYFACTSQESACSKIQVRNALP